ncbi:MAG TPA: malto-oligosyltrehalose synthase, partial [Terriglobales bacterium]|nr:malto-oligosyltrehalose synthase [Terriglobales bacterium]
MRAAIGLSTVESPQVAECIQKLIAQKESTRPGSTYRLQFNAGFRFEDARKLLPYLHALGITHCYSSPILRARAGSQHGYDITDHNTINPEIGTPEEFDAFVHDLKSFGMGLILDIVPNHMGVGYGSNPWWQDVLENGQASAHADYFDIDWRPLKSELTGKVLLPVLGAAYGEELEQDNLKITFENGAFVLSYYDRRFPIDPQTYPMLFEQLGNLFEMSSDHEWRETQAPALQSLIRNFRELPPSSSTDPDAKARRLRTVGVLKQQLAELADRSAAVKDVIDEAVRRINGDLQNPHSFDALHRILEAQAYRLAHWRVSAEEINYRRFFDINELVGLRMENPVVFADTHKLIRKLLANGSVSGIRLDHPDGLFNPIQYFSRLQMLYAASLCYGPEPSGAVADNGIEQDVLASCSAEEVPQDSPLYLVVEKILEAGEPLPKTWPVDGTVGYEFGNLLNNVFINPQARRFFTNLYHRFIGGAIDVNTLIYESKKRIMLSSLSSEVAVLSHMLEEISTSDRRARDFTRSLLRNAIRETIACFPVYRTYIDVRGTISNSDRGYIQEAIARAKRRNQNANLAVYDFLKSVLLLEGTSTNGGGELYRKRLLFTLKFQQLTGPVMAKGLEDTACYVYNRFISVNEVGGSPADFGISLEEFHRGNEERARDWPYSMLATSTHDSKRSEDVRARLNVLSEIPKQWSEQVIRWRRANRAKKRALADGRIVPDANEEYFLYQTLIGAWPFAMKTDEDRAAFTQRIKDYMIKAVHEAKVNLSWISQDQEYVDNLAQFIDRILRPGTSKRPNTFLELFENFIQPVSFFGAINSLAQVMIKATAPGVPDFYRGCELWDFSLVDPDNRRPVDYGLRESMLRKLKPAENDGTGVVGGVLNDLQDGRAKMWTTMRALHFRRAHPEFFRAGSDYLPLFADNGIHEHVIAFARQVDNEMTITVTPRFSSLLMKGEVAAPLGSEVWGDTAIILPRRAPEQFHNELTGEPLRVRDGRLLCREVFATFPIALL